MSSTFQLVLDAFDDYAKQVGVDLAKHPLADKIRGCDSPDAVLELLEDKARAFKVYREGNSDLVGWLRPIVRVIHAFSGVLGAAVSLVGSIRLILRVSLPFCY